jgi:hypothetical protein
VRIGSPRRLTGILTNFVISGFTGKSRYSTCLAVILPHRTSPNLPFRHAPILLESLQASLPGARSGVHQGSKSLVRLPRTREPVEDSQPRMLDKFLRLGREVPFKIGVRAPDISWFCSYVLVIRNSSIAFLRAVALQLSQTPSTISSHCTGASYASKFDVPALRPKA